MTIICIITTTHIYYTVSDNIVRKIIFPGEKTIQKM